MKTSRTILTLALAALCSIFATAAVAQQVPNAAVNLRVGLVQVTVNGIVQIAPESNTFRLVNGGNPPACSGGYIWISHNSAMQPYSEAIKDRMLATVTAAQLSGRLINGWLARDASNRCFLETINVLNQ